MRAQLLLLLDEPAEFSLPVKASTNGACSCS
jgi:hypothetical protein